MNGRIPAMGPQLGSGRKFGRQMLACSRLRHISIEPSNDYAATDATTVQTL